MAANLAVYKVLYLLTSLLSVNVSWSTRTDPTVCDLGCVHKFISDSCTCSHKWKKNQSYHTNTYPEDYRVLLSNDITNCTSFLYTRRRTLLGVILSAFISFSPVLDISLLYLLWKFSVIPLITFSSFFRPFTSVSIAIRMMVSWFSICLSISVSILSVSSHVAKFKKKYPKRPVVIACCNVDMFALRVRSRL